MGTGQEDRGRDHRQAPSPRLSCSGRRWKSGTRDPGQRGHGVPDSTLPRADGRQRPVPAAQQSTGRRHQRVTGSPAFPGAEVEEVTETGFTGTSRPAGERARLAAAPHGDRRFRAESHRGAGLCASDPGTCHQVNRRRHRSAAASATDQDRGTLTRWKEAWNSEARKYDPETGRYF